LMANLQASLRSQSALAFDQPEALLKSVNHLFYDTTGDNAYASLFYAEYDDATRRLRYANCGHLSGLLLRVDGDVEQLGSTSTLLGLFEEWDCSVREQEVSPGDVLALYTDGITEASNGRGEEFGERCLIEALRQHRQLSCQALLTALVDEVRRFSPQEQQDDITAIIAKFRVNG
jgi:serine phosphatase RsbU (regulator of sigma subunit)